MCSALTIRSSGPSSAAAELKRQASFMLSAFSRFFLLALLTLVVLPSIAQVNVTVSPEYRAIHYSRKITLKPGQMETVDLHKNDFDDSYQVFHSTNGGGVVSLVVLDGRDRAKNNSNPVPLLKRSLSGLGSVAISRPESSKGSIAVFINRGRWPIDMSLRIDRVGLRPESVRMQVRNFVQIPFQSLNSVYLLPPINVTVRPCGQVNAFSSPNITVCSELIADLVDKQLPHALIPILLHELGHSLLFLWKLPGYDNEELVDEFAGVLLAKHSPEVLREFINWFETQDPVAEAVAHLASAGKHPLSLQRAKSMRILTENSDAAFRKWSKVLGPHMRN